MVLRARHWAMAMVSVVLASLVVGAAQACTPDINNRIEVSTLGPCTSIQTAIDAADGVNPYLVDVLAGTYIVDDTLLMKSNVELRGAGNTVTAIARTPGVYYSGPMVTVHDVSGVTISGFTFDGGGIDVANYANVTISNNVITGAKFALYVFNGTGITVDFNTLQSSHTGVVLEDSTSVAIDSNLVEGFTDATGHAALLYNSVANITNNLVQNIAGDGFEVSHGSYTVSGNTVTSCGGTGWSQRTLSPYLAVASFTFGANTITC